LKVNCEARGKAVDRKRASTIAVMGAQREDSLDGDMGGEKSSADSKKYIAFVAGGMLAFRD
jgi:hypothetical protein